MSTVIYSKDANGRVRTWRFEVNGGQWRTVSGLMNGEKVTSGWTTCAGKNIGKKNETTPEVQAQREAEAERAKKLDRDYREAMEELDSVPPSPMLAQDFKAQKKLQWPMFIQPKLDGIRAFISRHGAFSRSYQRHHNIEHILTALAPLFAAEPDLILDGELYNHAYKHDFENLTSIIRTQKCTDEDRFLSAQVVQFHCYDLVSNEDFEMRSARLSQLVAMLSPSAPVVFVKTLFVQEQDHDTDYASFVEDGYEGAIYRAINGPYEVDKRSKLLLKRKDFITQEFPLVDVQEGNGNWAGFAKRIIFRMPDGRESEAGMRGSQTFARRLLLEKDRFIGGEVTIRYFRLTAKGLPYIPVATDFHPHGRVD